MTENQNDDTTPDQAEGEDIVTDDTLNRDADQTGTPDGSGAPVEGGLTEHQEGAPESAIKLVEESEAQGYLGQGTDKPDYSQANSAVMNGGA